MRIVARRITRAILVAFTPPPPPPPPRPPRNQSPGSPKCRHQVTCNPGYTPNVGMLTCDTSGGSAEAPRVFHRSPSRGPRVYSQTLNGKSRQTNLNPTTQTLNLNRVIGLTRKLDMGMRQAGCLCKGEACLFGPSTLSRFPLMPKKGAL